MLNYKSTILTASVHVNQWKKELNVTAGVILGQAFRTKQQPMNVFSQQLETDLQ